MMENMNQPGERVIAAAQKNREKNYWLKQLGGNLVKSVFPYDSLGERKDETSPKTKTFVFQLPAEASWRAIRLSKSSDLRLHILLVTAVSLLLAKYTGSRDIIVGVPIYKQEIEAEWINTVVAIRNRIFLHSTVKEFLLQVSQTIFEAAQHRNYPIQVLAEQLHMPPSLNKEDFPLFDTAVLLENIHDRGDLRHIPLNMIFSFVRLENDTRGKVEYNALRYSENRVKQIIRHLECLMEQIFFNSGIQLGDIDILSEEEKYRQIYTFNSTDAGYPVEKTLHQLFEEQTAQTPDHAALIGENPGIETRESKQEGTGGLNPLHITYKELNQKSGLLACILRNRGIKEESVTAIIAERSIEMIVGMLAVMKAGGTFLIISPGTPPGRKRFIIKDSGTLLILVKRGRQPQPIIEKDKDILHEFSALDLPLPDDKYFNKEETPSPGTNHRPNHLLYTVYTPGSAGKPRGVMVEHSALINFIYSLYNNYNCNFGPTDRCLSLTDISLDLSIGELFLPLVFGASVVLFPPGTQLDPGQLAKIIVEKAITFTFLPPVLLPEVGSYLKNHTSGSLLTPDKVLVGGESIRYDTLAEFQALNPAMQILNGYGPPEACICAATYKFTPTSAKSIKIPIGKPLPNTRVMVLDRDQELYPPGCTGELYISGAGLARGYLNNPELTTQKFTNKKLLQGVQGGGFLEKSPPGRRRQITHKTDELVRWLEDGNIQFVGIGGRQVEINGYRIEPGEIEHQLLKHKRIKEAVVIDKQTDSHDKYLCAYLVIHPSGAEAENVPTSVQLVDFLSDQLPPFMIPRYFIPLMVIPLTPNGKVDEKELPDPGKALGREYAAPEFVIEKTIAKAWEEILNKEKVGVNDNFFEIGGNSLGILKLKNRLKQELEQDIPDIKFLEYPTIRSFYNYLHREILGTKEDTREKEIDPHEVEADGTNKLRLRRKILGNIIDA